MPVDVAQRDWEKARRVPPDLQAEMTKLASEGVEAWAAARANDGSASFRPWLDRTLELKRRYVACFPATDDPYDPLLDDFERDMRTDEVRRVFDRLEPALRELLEATDHEEDEPFLTDSAYPESAQHDLSVTVTRAFGAADEFFRLDSTVHPFCTSFSTQDVRLTTRYAEDDLHASSIFSTMHEAGHGLYEHGGDSSLDRTPLATGCSSALHESQSRLWENVIGRSMQFWRWFYPQFRAVLHHSRGRPARGVPPRGQPAAPVPDPRRCGRDDLRAAHHRPLRPRAGAPVRRPRHEGLARALERPHGGARRDPAPGRPARLPPGREWGAGLFGYFPTYQLGNVLSVQIWERLLLDIPDAYAQIEVGSSRRDPRMAPSAPLPVRPQVQTTETILRVAGGPIDPEPYLRYLADKNASLAAA